MALLGNVSEVIESLAMLVWGSRSLKTLTSITLAQVGNVTVPSDKTATSAPSLKSQARPLRSLETIPQKRKIISMTNGPVDLEAHRTVVAQRLEVLRRKQLQELRSNLDELKAQQAAFESRLLKAIHDGEKHITVGQSSTHNTAAGLMPTRKNGRQSNGLSSQYEPPGNTEKPARGHRMAQTNAGHGQRFSKAPCEFKDGPTAIVYCEANFGEADGKTANGLVRHSENYRIIAVIDSRHCGKDAGTVLDGIPNGIPICRDLADATACVEGMPNCFIFGMAPSSGMLSQFERRVALDAMAQGMDIVNGLHEFLSEDDEFIAASISNNVQILDVRKPADKTTLKTFTGNIADVTCPVIAVLGTDCAIGKRTTASILTKAFNDRSVKTVMVSTGQTGLIQGARYGVALDAIPSQFCSGELEAAVITAFVSEKPDLIVVEGQGALSHPAFSTSAFILRGSQPDSVILQHAPGRTHRCDFDEMRMPEPADEVRLIECFADTRVIGLTINHENMSKQEVASDCKKYAHELGFPALDPLSDTPEDLIEMVVNAHTHLRKILKHPRQ